MDSDRYAVYERKYGDGEPVTDGDLAAAYRATAQLVAECGDEYLPLFTRLDDEVAARERACEARDRAVRVASLDLPPSGLNRRP